MSRRPAGRATVVTRRGGRSVGVERGDGGGKTEVERPRVRGVEGREVTIPSWETATQEDWLGPPRTAPEFDHRMRFEKFQ
jgi:hypothetical protein